jgi:hypothetical protein
MSMREVKCPISGCSQKIHEFVSTQLILRRVFEVVEYSCPKHGLVEVGYRLRSVDFISNNKEN